jgi:hypothetical protein
MLRVASVLLLGALILLGHEPFKTTDRRGKGEAYANSFAAGGTADLNPIHGQFRPRSPSCHR